MGLLFFLLFFGGEGVECCNSQKESRVVWSNGIWLKKVFLGGELFSSLYSFSSQGAMTNNKKGKDEQSIVTEGSTK